MYSIVLTFYMLTGQPHVVHPEQAQARFATMEQCRQALPQISSWISLRPGEKSFKASCIHG